MAHNPDISCRSLLGGTLSMDFGYRSIVLEIHQDIRSS